MKIKNSCIYLCCLIIGISNVTIAQSVKNKTEKQPNIILILGDDIGFETVSAYGSTSYKTPRIDAMAKQGVLFEQCYAQPLCSPSRIQIMTGKSNFRNYEK